VAIDIVGWGLSYLEASTGEFFSTQNLNDPDFYQLAALLSKVAPSEIIADARTIAELRKRALGPDGAVLSEWPLPADPSSRERGAAVNPGEPGAAWQRGAVWQNNKLALRTALNTAAYVRENQPGLKESFSPVFFEPSNRMQLDESAIKTLELVNSEYGEDSKTLWGVLDATKTSMGSRMLKKWILEPLTELHEINTRAHFTAFLARNREASDSLSDILSQMPDIERLLGRVINGSAAPGTPPPSAKPLAS